MYEELEKTLEAERKTFKEDMQRLTTAYDDARSMCNGHQKDIEIMKLNFQSSIEQKDEQIFSQKKTIEEYDAMFEELHAAKEMRIEYEKLIAEHPKENANLNNIVEELSTSCKRLSKVNDIGQIFSMKLKKKGSARNIQIRKCDQPLCDSTNVDMVRCNISARTLYVNNAMMCKLEI